MNQSQLFRQALRNLDAAGASQPPTRGSKLAMAPAAEIGAAPVDPATGQPMPPGSPQGAPPMDPSMMGGGMPPGAMPPGAPPDPSMMGGMPMDPSMMGGGMPMDPSMGGPIQEDPLIAIMEQLVKKVSQTLQIVATIADQLQVKIPIDKVLEAGEDVMDESLGGSAGGGEGSKSSYEYDYTDGYVANMPSTAVDITHRDPSEIFSAAAKVAQRAFSSRN